MGNDADAEVFDRPRGGYSQRMTKPDTERASDPEPQGAPDPEEQVAEGKDPGWPIPGLAGPSKAGSPASDADAPAPG